MTELPWHPKLVHLPIALSVLMPLLAGGLAASLWFGWFKRRVWLIALLGQLLLVASSFAAMQTGEEEEELVEDIVGEAHLEAHAEAADVFFWVAVAVLAMMVVVHLLPSERAAKWAAIAATAGAIAVTFLAVRVGEAGGELVYKYGAANAHIVTPGQPAW